MKARVKETGEEVEVEKLTSYLRDFGNGGKRRYEKYEVEILEEPCNAIDWQAYRREVTKECMAAYLGGLPQEDKVKMLSSMLVIKKSTVAMARLAVFTADALIDVLKGGEE